MIAKDKICAVVAAADASSMWRQLTVALRVTRTAELRLDWLSDDDELDKFLARLARKRPRATLILKKGADHVVETVALRRL